MIENVIYWTCFCYQAPAVEPAQVREADTLSTLKIRLKTFPFEKVYSQ